MTPFRRGRRLGSPPIVAAVVVPDRAEWPVLAPGQFVFVERLRRPQGANYFEQVFAVRYRGRLLVRHHQILGRRCCLWGTHPGFRLEDGGGIELITPPGWHSDDWVETGMVHPDLQLIGPAVYPYRHASRLQWGRECGRETPPIFFAWSN